MYINGNCGEASGGGRFGVLNPATGDKITDVPDGGREDAERAIEAASAAFPDWAAATAYERARLLNRAWQIMQERKEELARTMTEEQGNRFAQLATKSSTVPISCSGTPKKPSASTVQRSLPRVPTSVSLSPTSRSASSPRSRRGTTPSR